MTHSSEIEKTVNSDTTNFFNFITQPNNLELIFPLEKLITSTEDNRLKNFWHIFAEKNLECYKLEGRKKNRAWEVFYVDLETPIVFYPVFQDSLSFNAYRKFTSIAKTIKSNLSNYYNQETEILLILIEEGETEGKSSCNFYNVEEQMKSKVWIKDQKKKEKQADELSSEDNDEFVAQSDLFYLRNINEGLPFGYRNPDNKLSLLTEKEWIGFSKTWVIHRPPPRKKNEVLHPAKFPETLIREFITFFTKPGALVLDPFLGTGSALIAAKQSNRSGVGIELSASYTEISEKRLKELVLPAYTPLYQITKECFWKVICGDSHNLLRYWEDYKFPEVDFCITSPPYWNQLQRNTLRQKSRKDEGLDTKYSESDPKDLGNLNDYNEFLDEQQKIFGHVYELLKSSGYMVVINNNVFAQGRVYPLAYDTAKSLIQDEAHPWVLKDEKIWSQDDKRLIAFGVNNAYVGNRCHQYCQIFQKELSNIL